MQRSGSQPAPSKRVEFWMYPLVPFVDTGAVNSVNLPDTVLRKVGLGWESGCRNEFRVVDTDVEHYVMVL